MIKNYLGIEIGSRALKLVVCERGAIKKAFIERIPEGIVENDRIVNWVEMTEVLKRTLQKDKLRCKDVALVIPEGLTYVRKITMPYMTEPQLRFNLPFEFHDFISGNKEDYIYDYALIKVNEPNASGERTMEIMASAMAIEDFENYEKMIKACKLKLRIAVPESVAYQNIVKKYLNMRPEKQGKDFAILNMGYGAINLRIYTDGVYETGKEIKPGIAPIYDILRNKYQIDDWKQCNKMKLQEALEDPECMEVYGRFALDIMRVMSFFHYNHPNNTLTTLYCCGRGLSINPLKDTIRDTVGIKVEGLYELFSDICYDEKAMVYGAAGAGVTWNEEV